MDMKPKSPSLSLSYEISKKNKRKARMADGGEVLSASNEARPSTQTRANDAHTISRNSTQKPLVQAQSTDRPTVAQARRRSITPLSEPRTVNSQIIRPKGIDALGRLKDVERHIMETMKPDGGSSQPSKAMDELDAEKQGSDPDMDRQHSNGRKPYAEGGEVEDSDMQPEAEAEEEHEASILASIMAKRQRYASGGQVDLDLNSMEQPNEYYERNQAILKENYDEDMDDVDQPTDSNLMGDEEEQAASDPHDRVSAIRRRMKR